MAGMMKRSGPKIIRPIRESKSPRTEQVWLLSLIHILLRYSLDLDREADAVEAAVQKVLTEGYRTGDIMSEGCRPVGTAEMGDLIAAAV